VFAPLILPEGARIRNCLVEKKLGKGGFGITYLAAEYATRQSSNDLGPALRKVAIKEFFPQGIAWREEGYTVGPSPTMEGAGEAFSNGLRAFYKEAQALAGLDHENVIRLLSVFEANGTAYFIMPFIRGETLRSLLRRDRTLPEDRVRRLLLPVLDGLDHAHARGILHRDLKPDNIMIREEDGRPILIDFGTARAQTANDATQYTRLTDLVAYTPGYAALEQYSRAASDNRHGPWTDLYALGALLYEAVTGSAPPESALRAAEIGGGHGDPLQPVSARLNESPGYSRAFLLAVDWALELSAKDRPQSVAEFRAAVDGLRLPEAATLARLAAHGVSVEPLTLGPGPTAAASVVPQAPKSIPAPVISAGPAVPAADTLPGSAPPPQGGHPLDGMAQRRLMSRKATWATLLLLAIGVAAGIGVATHQALRAVAPPPPAAQTAAAKPAATALAVPQTPPAPQAVPLDPSVRETVRDCPDCPEMVHLSAGTFVMGSPDGEEQRSDDEGPQHRVRVSAFYIGKYAVTFDEWDACESAGGCATRAGDAGWGRGRRPVIKVSWNDAQQYARWLVAKTGRAYRLPSEAEWEYAARAGTVTPYWWGVAIGRDRANCDGCGSRWDNHQTAPVGSFPPNAFGLYEMLGNVWQWTQDCYNTGYAGAPADGSAWTTGHCAQRVARGGSWSDSPRDLRTASRSEGPAAASYSTESFRLARSE
jgi:formylglycine-generating enzyme required for sulfatase activity/serine/threonine protein kinase